MSSFTTQVRNICEMYAGGGRKGYVDIPQVILDSAPKIFDFDYPIFDESYRRVIETKILMHYYTREICEETVGLWKLRLMSRMNEIMPYFNQLYESELLKFNPFFDHDYTVEHRGRANERKEKSQNVDRQNNTDFTEHIDSDYTLDTDEKIVDNTKDVEQTVTKTVSVEDVDFTDDKTIDESEHITSDTTTDRTEHMTDVIDKTKTKDVTLNDNEHTDTVERETSLTVAHKIGNNDTHLKDDGTDVDTTEIDETKVRTPNLTNDKQNNKQFDDLGTGADNRNIQRSEYTGTTEDTSGNEHIVSDTERHSESTEYMSDTPQGNLVYAQDGTGGEFGTGQDLKSKLNIGWLTSAKQDESVQTEHGVSDRDTTSYTVGSKKFDETTDDDVTHTRNYKQLTDDHTITTDTGTETEKKDGTDVVTHEIDETHHTHYDIDETTTTDFTDDKTGKIDFSKIQTEHTDETEHDNEVQDKQVHETVHSEQDRTKHVDESEVSHKDDDTTTDFTGTVDDTIDYTRDKTIGNVYAADKDTENNRKFLETITDDTKHTIRNMDEYINHTAGKISDITYSKMLLEFRQTFLNIDMQVIEALRDLFFSIYI